MSVDIEQHSCNADAIICDVLKIMTKIGCVFVVNDEKELIGIITDGDLRRLLISPKFNQHVTVKEILIPNPKCVFIDFCDKMPTYHAYQANQTVCIFHFTWTRNISTFQGTLTLLPMVRNFQYQPVFDFNFVLKIRSKSRKVQNGPEKIQIVSKSPDLQISEIFIGSTSCSLSRLYSNIR